MDQSVDLPGGRAYRPGYEVVAEQLLELIAAEGLAPGDRIGTEKLLAERLGVSRTVVREAVKTLTAVGRLRARKGSGVFVADDAARLPGLDFFLPGDIDHVRMLFEFRAIQEEAAARLAAERATPPMVRALRAAADASLEHGKRREAREFGHADDEFHRLLAEASGNRLLVEAVRLSRRLQSQANVLGLRSTVAGSLEVAGDEHRGIVDAVAAGDPDAAARAVRVHLDGTRSQWEKALERFVRAESAADAAGDEGGRS